MVFEIIFFVCCLKLNLRPILSAWLVGLKSGCGANSNHIMKVNQYNFIRLHNYFVHYIILKCFMCGIIQFFFVVEGGI